MRQIWKPLAFILAAVLVITLTQIDWTAEKTTKPPHPARLTSVPQEAPPDIYSAPEHALIDYLHAQDVSAVTDYIAATARAEVGAYLISLTPPPAAPQSAPRTTGSRSYAWWEAIANCESGNTNAWRTGYYGLEGGPGVTYGGLSKAEQLAIAEGIYANYGDGAWGCAPVAWQNVPGG